MARLGAAVVVNDYGQPGRDGSGEASAAPAEEAAAEIRAAGGRATAHNGDVSDHEQARALVDLALSRYGKLDILVNNAGILNGQLLVVHGGMVAVVERPRVAATFDAAKETFTFGELDELLTPYYADRPRGETFAAAEVLGLRRDRGSGT